MSHSIAVADSGKGEKFRRLFDSVPGEEALLYLKEHVKEMREAKEKHGPYHCHFPHGLISHLIKGERLAFAREAMNLQVDFETMLHLSTYIQELSEGVRSEKGLAFATEVISELLERAKTETPPWAAREVDSTLLARTALGSGVSAESVVGSYRELGWDRHITTYDYEKYSSVRCDVFLCHLISSSPEGSFILTNAALEADDLERLKKLISLGAGVNAFCVGELVRRLLVERKESRAREVLDLVRENFPEKGEEFLARSCATTWGYCPEKQTRYLIKTYGMCDSVRRVILGCVESHVTVPEGSRLEEEEVSPGTSRRRFVSPEMYFSDVDKEEIQRSLSLCDLMLEEQPGNSRVLSLRSRCLKLLGREPLPGAAPLEDETPPEEENEVWHVPTHQCPVLFRLKESEEEPGELSALPILLAPPHSPRSPALPRGGGLAGG